MSDKPANSDIDNPADHGTDQYCDSCTGSGCSNVADSLTLTLRVKVRRNNGPAKSTADILWALQNAIATSADDGAFHVTGSTRASTTYDVEQVEYDLPAGTEQAS